MLEKFFKQKNSWELRKDEISKRIVFLESNPILEDDYKSYFDDLSELDKFNMTDLEKEKFNNLEKSFVSKLLKLDTISEFKYALEKIDLDSEAINHVVSHENAHSNKAEILGADVLGYYIAFVRKNDGRDAIMPMAYHSFNNDKKNKWTKEEYIEIERQIALAPDEYDNKSSEGDLKRVDYLDNLK